MSDLKAAALRALKLMDLTTLNDDDTTEKQWRFVMTRRLQQAIPLQSVFTLALSQPLRKRCVSKVLQKYALRL